MEVSQNFEIRGNIVKKYVYNISLADSFFFFFSKQAFDWSKFYEIAFLNYYIDK